MQSIDLASLVENQRKFFAEGKTLDVKYRIQHLKKLYKAISSNLNLIHEEKAKAKVICVKRAWCSANFRTY